MQKETNPEGVLPEYKQTKVQRFWLKHHQACQASGKSQADYAREHGLAIKSLYYWKKRLQHIGAIDADMPSAAPVFQKVQLATVAAAGIHCQIQFADGTVSRLPPGSVGREPVAAGPLYRNPVRVLQPAAYQHQDFVLAA